MKRIWLLFFGIFLCFVQTALADIYIIANADVPVGSLTPEEVKNIFIGQKKIWGNDLRVQVTLLKDYKPFDEFSKNYIGKSPNQFENWWKNMVFTGKGTMPKVFDNEADVLNFIAKTPGAIGYIATKPEAEVSIIKVMVIQ